MIPLGFRFKPTDEELVRYFLYSWVVGLPLPSNAIVYKSIYGPTAAPRSVFADDDVNSRWETKEEGGATKSTTFVFTNLTRVHNSKRISRTSGGGTWGGQTGPKKIFNSDTGEVIGHMRMLSFEHPDCGASSALGHWIMHEYVLSDMILKDIGKDGAGDMVVCKITRCVKNSGGKRRQPEIFPPAVVNVQESGCKTAAEECRVRELQETFARCIEYSGGDHEQPPQPQLQFFPPAAVVNVQETGRKRAAEESGVQETVCKKHKSGGGSVTEVIPEAAVVQSDSCEMYDDNFDIETLLGYEGSNCNKAE